MAKIFFVYLAAIIISVSGCRQPLAYQPQDGDIIFQTSRSNQSQAIQKATHSKYSHMGVIFLLDGKPYVYEAVNTVQYTPLKEWIARGEGGRYVIKRLREADRVLTSEAVARLRKAAKQFQGRPYDFTFAWSDDRIYCSELVWKIYNRGIGVRIGRLQKLMDLDLSDAAVKAKAKERYGDHVPVEEAIISPGEMFSSRLLEVVDEH